MNPVASFFFQSQICASSAKFLRGCNLKLEYSELHAEINFYSIILHIVANLLGLD
jgi:hypothetical protein